MTLRDREIEYSGEKFFKIRDLYADVMVTQGYHELNLLPKFVTVVYAWIGHFRDTS